MKRSSLSRRMFLRGAGGSAVVVPLLTSLLPRRLEAQVAKEPAPKRFIHFRTGHGGIWEEKLCPTDDVLTNKHTLLPGHEIAWGKLQRRVENGRARLSEVLSAPADVLTERLVGQLNLLRGFDVTYYHGHHTAGTLGTYNKDTGELLPNRQYPTIDQVMAASSGIYPEGSTFRRRLVWAGQPGALSFRWRDPKDHTAGVTSGDWSDYAPERLPAVLFSNAAPVLSPDAPPKRELLVDAVVAEYRRLRQGSVRLSRADKARLDEHMERLFEIQSRLAAMKPVECRDPMVPKYPQGEDYFHAMREIVLAAFQCDVTRIFIFNADESMFDQVHGGAGWHTVAHDSERTLEAQTWLAAANQQFFEKIVLELGRGLDAVATPTGKTLLDQTLIEWAWECATPSHNSIDYEIVTMGGAGGALRPGHYVDYRNRIPLCLQRSCDQNCYMGQRENYMGVPYTRLMANLLDVMDVPRSDWQQPDWKGYGWMPYDTQFLGRTRYVPGELEAASDPLPIIRAT